MIQIPPSPSPSPSRSLTLLRGALHIAFVLFLPCPLLAVSPAITEDDLARVQFQQQLGHQISITSSFQDETGKILPLSAFFHGRPVLLCLGYYRCPMLCDIVLNSLTECLQDFPPSHPVPLSANPVTRASPPASSSGVPPRPSSSSTPEFDLIFVSISPTESFTLASAKKETYLRRLGRPQARQSWHFLTGQPAAIATLTREIGFQYVYDPATHEYAHPSGFVILAADGRITRYFTGINFSPTELLASLREAQQTAAPSPSGPRPILRSQPLPLLQSIVCFHADLFRGKYSRDILFLVRAAALATLAALLLLILFCRRRAALPRSGPLPQDVPGPPHLSGGNTT